MLIIDMPMPENCSKCYLSTACSFCEGYDDVCVLAPKNAEYEWNFADGIKPIERPSWCPIKGELPDEHGDLIDRDVVKKEIMKRMPSWCGTSGTDGYQFCSRREMLYPISHAKVIIAAERKDDEQIH